MCYGHARQTDMGVDQYSYSGTMVVSNLKVEPGGSLTIHPCKECQWLSLG